MKVFGRMKRMKRQWTSSLTLIGQKMPDRYQKVGDDKDKIWNKVMPMRVDNGKIWNVLCRYRYIMFVYLAKHACCDSNECVSEIVAMSSRVLVYW